MHRLPRPRARALELLLAARRAPAPRSPVDVVPQPAPPAVGGDALRALDHLERQVARVAARQVWPSLNVERAAGGWSWEVSSPRGELLAGDVAPSQPEALEAGLAALAGATVRDALARGAVPPPGWFQVDG